MVLALGVTENPALPHEVRRFVAVLATGLVHVHAARQRHDAARRSSGCSASIACRRSTGCLRDRVLELSYAETSDMIARTAQEHDLHPEAVERALAPYKARQAAAGFREAVEEIALTEHDRLTVALVALGNQERMLVLDTLARRAASPAALQALMRNAEALVEGARSGGRLGYKRAAEAALAFPFSFKAAYFVYRRFGVSRFVGDRLGDRFETLLVTRLLIQELAGAAAKRSRSIFGERVGKLIDSILQARLDQTKSALDALRRQYLDYAAALEAQIPAPVGAAPRDGALPGPVRRGPDPGARSIAILRTASRTRRTRKFRRASTSASTRTRSSCGSICSPASIERHLESVQKLLQAPLHRAERTHRAEGRARRRGVFHRLRRRRGRLS